MKKLLYVSLAILSGGISCTDGNFRPSPNVIYISVEDMMPNWGCYGDSVAFTPNLDAFAKEAVLFDDAHCQVALCTPSRTSILTGIRPSTSGIVKIDDDWQKMLPNAVSLPRHFKNNGYHTVIAGKIHDYRCGGMDSAYVTEFDIHGMSDNELAIKAIDNAVSQNKPFFLALGYSQAHDPWTPSDWAKSKYSLNQFSAEGRTPEYNKKTYDENGIKELVQNYYGEITDVDSLIGEVLAKIKSLGLFDNTIILIGAMDHGYNFGYRGRWGKGNCYDNETRVPLLVRVPNNPNNGKKTPALVELVDIYPTLAELCGLPQPPQLLEGTSFKPLLENPGLTWKKAVFSHRAYSKGIVGVKTKDYSFIDFEGDSVQLFDRHNDPLNLVDIAAQYPEIVTQMQALVDAGWKNVKY